MFFFNQVKNKTSKYLFIKRNKDNNNKNEKKQIFFLKINQF